MHKYFFLFILSINLIGCSFWERDEIIGINVIDNKLHVMHKRLKGYTLPSLSIHGGSPHTRTTEIFDSSWSLTESSNHSLSVKKENDWKKITSVSGDWYPVLHKTPEIGSYIAYFNFSTKQRYAQRYSISPENNKETKFEFNCKPVKINPCFAVDRYANRFFAAGSIYNVSDFTLLQNLESKKGYAEFIKLINESKPQHLPIAHMPTLIKLSSDGLFLFYISGFWNTKTILTYNIKSDSAEEVKLDSLHIKTEEEIEIEDIDSHKETLQIILQTQKSKKGNCNSPCSYSFDPGYTIFNITENKSYLIPIQDFYYMATPSFWDIQNKTLYALPGKVIGDIDRLEVFNYANNSTSILHLNHLKH